ncbi:SRPBCC family protein [Mesorhizobium sp. NZP2077]|uniref:SRPBCC family protein n=1 Tax=Mesorhizobium sp. NZP2077 TaxID=2483404 RepID=UPI001553F110|nr:SRPBCC family protein [Mesorhizobium sp. NZP2077]QKC83562.1 SRPBCC domain-containing protein [Mesorhizobium sp. NZP2077]QKD17080.1 SRPBCC domain-containing protein [Mesorhizobium sp. NZP2077]
MAVSDNLRSQASNSFLVRTRRSFDHSREAVYAAWVTPEIVRRWLFVSPSNKIISVQIEPHLGGLFSVEESNNEEMIKHWGHFTRVDPPHRLALTLNVPKHFQGESRIAVDIERAANGCRLTLTQTEAAPENAERIWQGMFDVLTNVLKGRQAFERL